MDLNFILLEEDVKDEQLPFQLPNDDLFNNHFGDAIDDLKFPTTFVLVALAGRTAVGFIDFSVIEKLLEVELVMTTTAYQRRNVCTNMFRYLCRIAYNNFNVNEISLYNSGGLPSFKCYYAGSRQLFPFIVCDDKLLTHIPQELSQLFHFLTSDNPELSKFL